MPWLLAAAQMGVPVVAASWLKPHYKAASLYCAPEEAVSRLISKISRKRSTRSVSVFGIAGR